MQLPDEQAGHDGPEPEILDPRSVVGEFCFFTYDRYPGGNADNWKVKVTLVTEPGGEPTLQAMATHDWDGSYYVLPRRSVPLGALTEKVQKIVDLGQALIDSGQRQFERYICDERYDNQAYDTEWTALEFRLYGELGACADYSYALNVIRSALARRDWVEGDPSIPHPEAPVQAFIDAVFDLTGISRKVRDFAEGKDAFWAAVGEWPAPRTDEEAPLSDWLKEAGQAVRAAEQAAERSPAPVELSHRKLRWERRELPRFVRDFDQGDLRQILRHGTLCDGQELSAEERLVDPGLSRDHQELEPEEFAARGPLRTKYWEHAVVLEDAGAPVLDVWVRSGYHTLFLAGTTDCVGRGDSDCGWFVCADLQLWEALARDSDPGAEFEGMDLNSCCRNMALCWQQAAETLSVSIFVLTPERSAALAAAPGDPRRLLGHADVDLGTAWRPLLLVIAPWDPDGTGARVLTAAAPGVLPDVQLDRGVQPAYFPADRVAAIGEVLARIPEDAARQQVAAIRAAYPRDRRPQIRALDRLLSDLRAAVSLASASGAGLLVTVTATY